MGDLPQALQPYLFGNISINFGKLCWNICLVVSNAMSRSEYVVLCEAVVYRPVMMSRALSRCFKNCENQTEQYCPFAWTVVIYFRLRCTSNWPWQSLHQGTQRVGSLCWCSPYRCILSTISLLSFLHVCSPSSYLILNPVRKSIVISLLITNDSKNIQSDNRFIAIYCFISL